MLVETGFWLKALGYHYRSWIEYTYECASVGYRPEAKCSGDYRWHLDEGELMARVTAVRDMFNRVEMEVMLHNFTELEIAGEY